MVFANDRQRKAVMAMLNKADNDINKVYLRTNESFAKATVDEMDDIRRKHDADMHKVKEEIAHIERTSDDRILFSEKRGSVPLLDTTFVIRGGSPKERQVIKKLLDSVGSETPLSQINTVRIEPDLKEPFVINQESRTLSVRSADLHIKTGDFPVDLAMAILARALTIKDPSISDEAALDRAREAVTLYIADSQHKERLKREKENIEVYQVGADRQPEFEVAASGGPQISPVEVKLVQEAVPQERQPIEQPAVFREPPEPIFK